ncbi:hypothetical protein VTN49DRAFT_2979 [Thermomyces lanuginosus]|uniref:uncharacterized protein n=1 Tax=Thermomyces lanuginosus TaxID=5541 RepID=UPI0037447782
MTVPNALSNVIEDNEDPYECLAQILLTRNSDEVLEIEVLPPGLGGNLLRDGRAVGISKKALARAFLTARKIYFERYHCMSDPQLIETIEHDPRDSVASEVILLFDCEFTTACNWRKRRIRALVERDGLNSGPISALLQREMSLLTTYVCSPLHRHTKSPTLWQHRLWVVKMQLESAADHGKMLVDEFNVALRAAELHPSNYYAFSYMRQLHAEVVARGCNGNVEDVLIQRMLSWCLAHPADVSGWAFLFYLLNQPGGVPAVQRQRVMDRVIEFAVHVAAWQGESLWTFVDLMLRRFGPDILPAQLAGSLAVKQPETAKSTPPRWKTTMQRIQDIA